MWFSLCFSHLRLALLLGVWVDIYHRINNSLLLSLHMFLLPFSLFLSLSVASYIYIKLFAIVSQVSSGSFSTLPLPVNSFYILVRIISIDFTWTSLILYYASLLISPLKEFKISVLFSEPLTCNGCWSTLFEYFYVCVPCRLSLAE